MLTAPASTFARELVRALHQPRVRIMAARIVGEADSEEAIQAVAERMLERERDGKPRPAKLEHYVARSVRRECFRIFNESVRERSIFVSAQAQDRVVAGKRPAPYDRHVNDEIQLAAPEPEPPQTDVSGTIARALDRISERQRQQIKLTYWTEIPVRDSARRGCPFGTAVSTTSAGKKRLREIEETYEAAHALGIGEQREGARVRRSFEPVDAKAWARECAHLTDAWGLRVLDLVEIWTSLAVHRACSIEAVEDWAMRIASATTEQMDLAEILIERHWATARASADVRGAA